MNAEEREKRLAVLEKRAFQSRIKTAKRPGEDLASAIDLDELPDTKRIRGMCYGEGTKDDGSKQTIARSLQQDLSSTRTNLKIHHKSVLPDDFGNGSREPANLPSLEYREGQVLLTKASAQEQALHHVSLEEILDRNNLRRAVLSAFQIDLEWILQKLNLGKTAIHIAFHAKDVSAVEHWTQGCKLLPKVFPIFPPMANGVNCMHSKLQLLFFDQYVRLVLPSANLVSYDWGEGGTMENVLYIQDFPLKEVKRVPDVRDADTEDESESDPEGQQGKSPAGRRPSTFLKDLIYFLKRSQYPQRIIDDLHSYDWSMTDGIKFIGTIGGENLGTAQINMTGIVRLANVVKSISPIPDLGNVKVDFITASLGNLNRNFVTTLLRACTGTPLNVQPNTNLSDTKYEAAINDFKIHFPTKQAVHSSRAGSAGTICFQHKYFSSPQFPRASLIQHLAVRPRLLSHCKIMLCRSKTKENEGWAYIGSANCSASAWGEKIVKDRARKTDKMTCRNWEAGVVVNLSKVMDRLPVVLDHGKVNCDPWFFMEDVQQQQSYK